MNDQEFIKKIEGVTIDLSHKNILRSYNWKYLDSIKEKSEYMCRPTWGPEGELQIQLYEQDLTGYWDDYFIMLRPQPVNYYFRVPVTHTIQEWFQVFRDNYKNRNRRGITEPTLQDEIPDPLPDPIIIQIRDGIGIDKTLIHTQITLNNTVKDKENELKDKFTPKIYKHERKPGDPPDPIPQWEDNTCS